MNIEKELESFRLMKQDLASPVPSDLKLSCDQIFLLLSMKQSRRKAKGLRLNAAILESEQELRDLLSQVKLRNIGIDFRFQIIICHYNHWFMIDVEKKQGEINFFIFDPVAAHEYVSSCLSTIHHIFPTAKIWIYASTTVQDHHLLPHSNIQTDFVSCGWFALEVVFRLSKIDVFGILSSNASSIEKNYIYRQEYLRFLYKQELWRNSNVVKLIFPCSLPDELGVCFISHQSSKVYHSLQLPVADFIVSSKGLSLQKTIDRRSLAGLKLSGIKSQFPSATALKKNYSITYFKLKYLDEIITWIETNRIKLMAINDDDRLDLNSLISQ